MIGVSKSFERGEDRKEDTYKDETQDGVDLMLLGSAKKAVEHHEKRCDGEPGCGEGRS